MAARVICTADGIGDAVQGLLACAGLQRDGRGPVTYVVKPHQAPWVHLFGGYDALEVDPEPGPPPTPLAVHFGLAEPPAPDCYYPHLTYGEQNRTFLERPRWEHYAAACGTEAVLPPVRERDIASSPLSLGWKPRSKVLLAPACSREAGPSRRWLLSHWLRLESLLKDADCHISLADKDDSLIRHFHGTQFTDYGPGDVAGLMRYMDCVVSADTGIAHVAGLLRVPAIVLCAQVRGRQVYGCYPTVRVIQGPLPCTGCQWQPGTEYQPHCRALCAALQSITPEQVAEQVLALPPR